MTTANDLDYDDPDLDNPDPAADEKARRQAAFAKRQQEREAEKAELAELRQFKADSDRREALDKARADLNAEGPLGAFLRTYAGEPTADAIKAAVESDPDFKALITFTPDINEAAAQVGAENARRLSGGGVAPTEFTPEDFAALDMNEQVRFMESHPDAMLALEAGKATVRPAGW